MASVKKKLSIAIAGTVLSAFCWGLEPAHSQVSGGGEPQNIQVVLPNAPGREAYYVENSLYTFLATGAQTNGQLSLFDFAIPPQAGPPVSIHTGEDEAFYVLDGNLTFTVGNQTVVGTPGTFVYFPVGVPRNFKNLGTTTAKMLSFYLPSGFENFFREVGGQPVTDTSAPIPPPLPLEQAVPIAIKYGLQVVDPSQVPESTTGKALLVLPDADRPSFSADGGLYTSLAASEETGGKLSLFDVFLPPQAGPQLLQSNAQAAESFYVVDGEVTFQIGDQTTVGKPGTFVYIPKGTSYAYQNLGMTPARTLSLRTATRVPEPSSWLSLLGFGAFVGANLVLKRKQKKQKSADLNTNTDTVCLMNNSHKKALVVLKL
jgi:quercetin dioxygenase-like cupin family protein